MNQSSFQTAESDRGGPATAATRTCHRPGWRGGENLRRTLRRWHVIACLASAMVAAMHLVTAAEHPAPEPADAVDLERVIASALASNPEVRAARLRYEAMLERPAQERALPDPLLAYTFMLEDIVTANGPVTSTLELSQEIPFRRKRPLRAEASRLEAEAAEQAWLAARLNVTYMVRSAYYDLFRIGRSIDIVQDEGELIDRLEQVARGRYATGFVGLEDVLRAQTERTTIEERLLALRQEREAAAARFNEALGRPQSHAVGRAIDPPDRAEGLPADDQLYQLARDLRPEVAEARRIVDAGMTMEKLARRDYLPDFRVGVQWNQVDETANPFAPAPGQDAYMVTVGINLPLWRGKLAAGVREAQAMTSSARNEVQTRGNRAEAEVRAVLASVRAQRDLVALYETTLLPQAESTLQAAEAAYQAGKTDLLSVLDSERRLLTVRLRHAVGLGEIGKAVAALERAVGRDVDELRAARITDAAGENVR